MLLQIIVTHYNEEEKYVTDFLDSLYLQQFIDKTQFEVLLINDGDQVVLNEDIFKKYDFSIKYHVKPWGGISDARQFGQDLATASYIMFCDCDDMFSGVDSLYKIFLELQKNKCDLLVCGYNHILENGQLITVEAKMARTQAMIHGKIYNRLFLLDKLIYWDKSIISMHEDFFFYSQVLGEAKNVVELNHPVYLWRYRFGSMSNKGTDFWAQEDIRRLAIEYKVAAELKKRKLMAQFKLKLLDLIFNTYYHYEDAKKYQLDKFVLDMLKQTVITFNKDIMQLTKNDFSERISQLSKNQLIKMTMNPVSFGSWLDKILITGPNK